MAAWRGDADRVRVLLDSGAYVNGRFGAGDPKVFQDKEGGWPMAASQWTALIAAADGEEQAPTPDGRLRTMDLLIRRGADLNADDGYGTTALATAVYQNARIGSGEHEQIALRLIEAGANVNTRTGIYIDGTDDIAPIHRATRSRAILRALLAHGADVNARDGDGETPLHWAVRDSRLDIVEILIEAHAELSVRDHEGRTPLFWVSPPSVAWLRSEEPEWGDRRIDEFRRIYREDAMTPEARGIEERLRAAGAME